MTNKYTNKKFQEKLYNLTKNEFINISPYVKSNQPIIMKHNVCGYEWEITPGHFLSKDRMYCPKCHNHGNKKLLSQLINDLDKADVDNEYVFKHLDSYKNTNTKIDLYHKKCGHSFKMTPHMFISGHRCSYCYGNYRKTIKEFSQEVYKLTDNKYKVISNVYVNNRTKVSIKHISCGTIYDVTPHDFTSGNRCPRCKKSKGEQFIERVLVELGLNYIPQKVFKDCGNEKQRLPYDFYLPDYNTIIEFDGIQHYKPIEWFGGNISFIEQQKRDKIKNNFAIDNHIRLVRFRYNQTEEIIRSDIYKMFS